MACAHVNRESAYGWHHAACRRPVSADSQPYRVEMGVTGSGSLNAMLRVTYDLISPRGSAPVWVFLESVIFLPEGYRMWTNP